MFPDPFTRDLNIITSRRRTQFLPGNTHRIIPLDDAMYLLRRFNINSMCLATDIAAFRRKKNALQGLSGKKKFFSTQPLRKVCIANRNIGQFC